jgi:hypothetical protein
MTRFKQEPAKESVVWVPYSWQNSCTSNYGASLLNLLVARNRMMRKTVAGLKPLVTVAIALPFQYPKRQPLCTFI